MDAALYQITHFYGLGPGCGITYGVLDISRTSIFSQKTSFTHQAVISNVKEIERLDLPL